MTGSGDARIAAAVELGLPGERRLSLHGFYESRLLFVGSELPRNGATWSSWRHVLSAEVELSLFPDGFGPIDSVFLFSRFLASYDCIYTYACGAFNSADSYGDDRREAVRQPLSLEEGVRNRAPYFAGLLRQTYRPGSLTPAREELNPGRRYRDCDNPPGVFSNPFPLAQFCNLNHRSPLDNPNNQTGVGAWEARAGTFHPATRPSLTVAARTHLGTDEYLRLQRLLVDGRVLSRSDASFRLTLLAEAREAAARGDPARAGLLRAQADAILGTPATSFDANVPALLATRPDANRFAILAGVLAPELLEAKWGSSELRDSVWPFLATIDTPIRPGGYFAAGAALDGVGEYDEALAESLTVAVAGMPVVSDADGLPILTSENAFRGVVPFFVGPDGVRDTADDLPYVAGNPAAQVAGYAIDAPIRGTLEASFDGTFGRNRPGVSVARAIYGRAARIAVPAANDPSSTKLVELYGVYSDSYLTSEGCAGLGSYNSLTDRCLAGGADVTPEARARGCSAIVRQQGAQSGVGVNADGDCIEVNTRSPSSGSQLQYEVIALLGDASARPAEAALEPLDATDFRAVADGGALNTLPARPRAPGHGLVFRSPGERREYEQYHHLVSSLDLAYSVDNLQWNHGASQREHEFAEGYLELEALDRQLFARLGKLIVVWGKTELFRNQDRNNPLDVGNGLFVPLEEQRIGQWALDLTISPDALMRVGPVEDLRLELLTIFNPFEPTDLGKCGEGSAVDMICLKSFGALANGLSGIGVVGEHRPYYDRSGIERWDFGARIEGRFDRFTFAVSDFWGWDDGAHLDLVQQYERTSDPTTGAPLSVGSRARSTGCAIRTVEGAEGPLAVGPNGVPGDGDDAFPSAGECLLWNPPASPGAPQTLRDPGDVAALHNVNQTLFHSLCAFTFDPDEGFCPLDRLNYPYEFGPISSILAGLGVPGAVVLEGSDTIQPRRADGRAGVVARGTNAWLVRSFLAIQPLALQDGVYQDVGASLQPEQSALLGCGEAYASPCSSQQQATWSADPAISADLTRDPALGMSRVGGLDLMNADASVVTQEFVGLKALSPGALVGTRLDAAQRLTYQAGIDYSRDGQRAMDVDADFTRQGQPIDPPPGVPEIESGGAYLGLTPYDVIALGARGRAELQIQPGNMLEADGWIEPMPWTVNQEMLERHGAIVFETDPANPLDLDSPLNRWNLIDPDQDPNDLASIDYSDVDGEYCARWMTASDLDVATPFNLGCTALETVSANLERLLISLEVIGFDRVFDPPESLQELGAWAQASTALQAAGDPIAGPDGIFARNQFVLSDEEMDFDVLLAAPTGDASFVGIDAADGETAKESARRTLLAYDPEHACASAFCYLQVNDVLTDPLDAPADAGALILAMPVGFAVNVVAPATSPGDPNAPVDPNDPGQAFEATGATRKVNLAALQYLQQTAGLPTLRRLLSSRVVAIDTEFGVEYVQMSNDQRDALFGRVGSGTLTGRDMDGDQSSDLDRDRDGVWDGLDDYSPGPMTDDNVLCGSGVPGDRLQDGVQYQPYRADEAPGSPAFAALFPNGLPPRSPVFCRGVSRILDTTSQSLPVRKAGGDGRYGRRDFLWQTGRQVVFDYQKRNVLGFALDFAEDLTKTSWGIELSWTANKLFPNGFEYDGLSSSDELVVSISVDRPTFLNFLNPNRSFFVNLQTFLRYLPGYEGGRGSGDGMYGTAGASLTGNVALTFFTGYFQDRLSPRVTLLYAPWESQGALIAGLSYQWTDALSTSIGFASFFGHVYAKQGAYFPNDPYASIAEYSDPVLRGVATVLYRDQADLRIRYSW